MYSYVSVVKRHCLVFCVCVCEEEQFSQCFHSLRCRLLFLFSLYTTKTRESSRNVGVFRLKKMVCHPLQQWKFTSFCFVIIKLNTQQKHKRIHKTVRTHTHTHRHSVNTFVINFVWMLLISSAERRKREEKLFLVNNQKSGVILRSFPNV